MTTSEHKHLSDLRALAESANKALWRSAEALANDAASYAASVGGYTVEADGADASESRWKDITGRLSKALKGAAE